MRPIVTMMSTAAAALLASASLAQQTDGVEDPNALQIQSSTVIPDATDIPDIPPGTQEVDVEGAGDGYPTLEPVAGTSAGGETQATEDVEEMIEDGEVVDAKPTESWLGCSPDAGDLPEHCERTAETPVDQPLPSADGVGDTAAVEDGGEGTTVRPPPPGNDAVDNLTTGGGAAPAPANEPAVMSVPAVVDRTLPERPQELENEPDEVLTREGGVMDLEKDARVKPETSTAVTR